jgi:endonuclease YncB( thermonuclease family)
MTSLVVIGLMAVGLSETVTIKDVLNSNTVVVQTAAEPNLWVSLLGVGTPDTIDPRKPKHLFALAKEDLGWTRVYLKEGSQARMERMGTTRTGRPLVLLFRLSDGLCWNEWLIRSGGAFFTTTDKVNYADQESAARAARLGVWASLPEPSIKKPEESVTTRRPQMTFTGVPGGNAIYRRRRYARQDWSQFDMMMNSMMSMPTYGGVNPNQIYVGSYTRSDGTFVRGHMRTMPNSTTLDNLGRR